MLEIEMTMYLKMVTWQARREFSLHAFAIYDFAKSHFCGCHLFPRYL